MCEAEGLWLFQVPPPTPLVPMALPHSAQYLGLVVPAHSRREKKVTPGFRRRRARAGAPGPALLVVEFP